MRPETIETITRHLKGIVAALEKEKTPTIWKFRGTDLKNCTDEEILEAVKFHYTLGAQPYLTSDAYRDQSEALDVEIKKREIGKQAIEIALKAAKQ